MEMLQLTCEGRKEEYLITDEGIIPKSVTPIREYNFTVSIVSSLTQLIKIRTSEILNLLKNLSMCSYSLQLKDDVIYGSTRTHDVLESVVDKFNNDSQIQVKLWQC